MQNPVLKNPEPKAGWPWVLVVFYDYTRRFLGGRQPLCGSGVMSLIITISRPDCDSERIAPSRPEPGPLTNTSTRFKPASSAVLAASAAAIWAA